MAAEVVWMADASDNPGVEALLSKSSRHYQTLDDATARINARKLETNLECHRLRLDQAVLKKFIVGPDVLDFPVGTGRLLEFAAGRYNLVGYDISPVYIEQAKARYPHIADHFEVHSMERISNSRQFNSVYSLRVTAHIQELEVAIGAVAKIIAPGGRWIFNIAPGHQDYPRLASLLKRNGLAMVRLLKYDAYSGHRSMKGSVQRFYARWLRVVERAPVPFWLYRLVDNLMLPFAHTVLIVAEKPHGGQ